MGLRRGLLLSLSAIVLSAVWGGTSQAQTALTWTVDGVQREALVFSPAPTASSVKHPVIFAFHGHGGNSQGTAQMMDLHSLWPEAIVVYPQGLPAPSLANPQAPLKPGWQYEAGDSGDRDLKFFDAMLSSLKQDYDVDDSRIYTTGFSNGAMFSYLLWAERGKKLAAVAVVAGALVDSVHPSPARPLVVISGELDETCLFSKQLQSIETARQINNAIGPGQPCGPICTWYTSATQTPVRTYIHPKGHVYPPWAGHESVKFFQHHKL